MSDCVVAHAKKEPLSEEEDDWNLILTLNYPDYTTKITLDDVGRGRTDEVWQGIIDGDAASVPRYFPIELVDGGESYEFQSAFERECIDTIVNIKISRRIVAPAIAEALGLRAPLDGANIKGAGS